MEHRPMSQSLANIVVHLVFSTKGRRQLLRDDERGELHAYITGILKNLQSPLIEINSVRDHIHILFVQSKNHAPAKIVEEVKTSSSRWLRACLKIRKGAVFAPRAGWRGATKENIPGGSSTEEQRSQPACGAKTLREAVLLAVAGVGSVLTARCGDARTSPPWPHPKSLAAAPFLVFRQALILIRFQDETNCGSVPGWQDHVEWIHSL